MATKAATKYPGRPLKRGSHGQAVKALQRRLNRLGGKQLTVDGEFGPSTVTKVNEFQHYRHLGRTGVVDAVIWGRVFDQPPPKLHPRSPETDDDKLRRLRKEVPVRQSQLKKLPAGKHRTAVARRYHAVTGAIVKLVTPSRAVVDGNRVTGGTPRERLVVAALMAAHLSTTGARRSFYSQDGFWTVERGITGEAAGQRSDCSQWFTSMYWSAGLPDPNGQGYDGGYTGTIAAHCRAIARAILLPGDPIEYGKGAPFEHVEMYVGLGKGLPLYLRKKLKALGFTDQTTIGHGSPPVDTAWIDVLPDPHYFTAFE